MKRFWITGLLALSGAALAVGAPAGSTISNTGSLDYSTDDTAAGPQTATSNTVNIQVQQVYGVSVTPDGTAGTPGQTYTVDPSTGAVTRYGVLTYSLTNTGNGSDSDVLSVFAQSANVTAANVKFYDDTNGNGSYDAGDTLITGYTNLAADASKTFFAVYPIPVNQAAGTTYDINPQAKSVATGTTAAPAGPTDNNNYGRIAVNTIYDLSLAASNTGFVTVTGTKTYTETLTNTGNAPVSTSQLNVTQAVTNADKTGAALAAGAFTVSYTATYKGTTGAAAANPQTAISNALGANSLASGEVVTLAVSVTAPTGRQDGDKNTDVLTALLNVTTSTTVKNNAATSNGGNTITDVTTVQRGVASFVKLQALCGTSGATVPASCPNSASAVQTDVNAKPGDYVVYYLKANNTGTGNLLAVKLRDTLPANTVMYSVGASVTGFTGTVLYSTDGTTWKTDPTTLGAFTAGTTVLYVGVDTNNDNTITAADSVPGGSQILVRIKVKVRDAAAAPAAPVADGQTVN